MTNRLVARLMLWMRSNGLIRGVAYWLTAAALLSGFVTYMAMSEVGRDPATILVLLVLDVALLLTLGAIIAWRLAGMWADRKKGQAGSRLHSRFVLLFGLVAVTPSILMAVFSTMFFNIGVQSWFSDRVQTALMESRAVAKAYLEEHQRVIGGDAYAMANDLNREGMLLFQNPQRLSQIVATQAAVRSLTEAVIFDANRRILAKSGLAYSMELSLDQIPAWAFEQAQRGEAAILTTDDDDRVRALIRLDNGFSDIYLFVGRFVDPRVINHMERTNQAVEEYQRLEGSRSGLEITFSLVYAVVALLLLLAAIWVGLLLAGRLARPIMSLIDAAETVSQGDLTARVKDYGSDELGSLSRAFNRMVNQLARQRRSLIEANRELDERRRFTETVLTGVSAGVIGLDHLGRIDLPNPSASDLLGLDLRNAKGRRLTDVLPEIFEMFETVSRRPEKLLQTELSLTRGDRTRTFLMRLAAERLGEEIIGYVLTFDDITELVSAQRKAAWADVARRIAHEIKNPLTPIQLSAERLKRKYLKDISNDPETFGKLTDTIIRQVGDIGRMVDEFSAFARMPMPAIKEEDLREIVAQAVFLQKTAHPSIGFQIDLPDHPLILRADAGLLGQALINVIKNAAEAIEGRDDKNAPSGEIIVHLFQEQDKAIIEIMDNGKGLPKEARERLTEPYVTTRAKGTGLGLAIVKKIMEDHCGELILQDRQGGGACIRLIVPMAEETAFHDA